ncbi:hypothetical protein HDV00_004609 [Rhizophlyctis rosea]|nr:hypothetical protein HDV00_004609 [Rhizophlyctis rosea]
MEFGSKRSNNSEPTNGVGASTFGGSRLNGGANDRSSISSSSFGNGFSHTAAQNQEKEIPAAATNDESTSYDTKTIITATGLTAETVREVLDRFERQYGPILENKSKNNWLVMRLKDESSVKRALAQGSISLYGNLVMIKQGDLVGALREGPGDAEGSSDTDVLSRAATPGGLLLEDETPPFDPASSPTPFRRTKRPQLRLNDTPGYTSGPQAQAITPASALPRHVRKEGLNRGLDTPTVNGWLGRPVIGVPEEVGSRGDGDAHTPRSSEGDRFGDSPFRDLKKDVGDGDGAVKPAGLWAKFQEYVLGW